MQCIVTARQKLGNGGGDILDCHGSNRVKKHLYIAHIFCVFLLLILLYLDKVATDSSHFVAKFHCNAIVSCGEIANKLIEDCLVIFNQNNPYIYIYIAYLHDLAPMRVVFSIGILVKWCWIVSLYLIHRLIL